MTEMIRYYFLLTLLLFGCTCTKEVTYDCSEVATETMVELIRICESTREHGSPYDVGECHKEARAAVCRPAGEPVKK
jgi:hypothetical protein